MTPLMPEPTAVLPLEAPLTISPATLDASQRRLFLVLAVVTALTRLWALSRSWWDWDEALFCSALRLYNVASHHPHPPGFPLYIGMARIIRGIVSDDFHALQSVNFLAAVSLFPAVFLLARRCSLSFRISISSALLAAFIPTMWLFGGTGFSDVPSVVLVVIASASLLKGKSSRGHYFLGTVLLAIAIGFRPQNLVVGLAPGIFATWFRWKERKRDVVLAAIAGLVIVGGAYGAAAVLTGPRDYFDAVQVHRLYITRNDSWLSPGRPPLTNVALNFFLRCYGAGRKGDFLLALLSTAGLFLLLFRQPKFSRILLLMFGPLAVLAWLYLDHLSAARFSIGYMPLLAILIACGIDPLASVMARLFPSGSALPLVLVLGGLCRAAIPGIAIVRSTPSPPAAAMVWARQHLDPRTTTLYATHGMIPFVEYALPGYHVRHVSDERSVPLLDERRSAGAFLVQEGASGGNGVDFARPRGPLWDIVRHRYFEVSIVPLLKAAHFGQGWYEGENSGLEVWRWMGRHSVTGLPPTSGPTLLVLALQFPLDTLPAAPDVVIRFNGAEIDRFHVSVWQMTRRYRLQPHPGAPNILQIETDQVVNPAKRHLNDDTRDLGILLTSLSWGK
jgi:hypothetical protein